LEKNLADLQELIGPEFYRNCFWIALSYWHQHMLCSFVGPEGFFFLTGFFIFHHHYNVYSFILPVSLVSHPSWTSLNNSANKVRICSVLEKTCLD
jgi:hypothetical protein